MKRIFFLLLVLSPGVSNADKVWKSGKGATWDCKKDPNVSITHGNGTYKFKGACATINVTGANLKVTAESADTINISGAKNTVTVAKVDALNVTGSKNTVTWKAGKSGAAASVSNVGTGNTINGGTTPVAADSAATPAPAAPAPAGAIDCGKTATHMISDNDRNLTYVGKCDKIVLDGNNITIKVESAKGIAVNGNDCKVVADAVDQIYVAGNNNSVAYKKGVTTAKPKIGNPGNGNSIKQVK